MRHLRNAVAMKDIVITTVTKRLTDEHGHEYINAK